MVKPAANDWQIRLVPSWRWSLVICLLHAAVSVSLALVGGGAFSLIPLVLLIMLFNVAKFGLLMLDRSVVKIEWRSNHWYLVLKDQSVLGPFTLTPRTQLEHGFVRLSLRSNKGRVRHQLITGSMLTREELRRLKVFLRWWPH